MKILVPIVFLTLSLLSFAQPLSHYGEVIIEIINLPGSYEVIFNAEVEKWNYDNFESRWDEDYNLIRSNDYTSVNDTVLGPFAYIGRFDLIVDNIAGLNPVLAIAKYRISAIINGAERDYFFLDLRTSDYGPSPDVVFQYDYQTHTFMESSKTISGTTQYIWDLLEEIGHVTSNLELYLSISNHNNHPKLTWNPFTGEFTHYQILRKYGGSDWEEYIDNISKDLTTYTDLAVSYAGQVAGTYVQYKVYPYKSPLYSYGVVSNTDGIFAAGGQIEKNKPESLKNVA